MAEGIDSVFRVTQLVTEQTPKAAGEASRTYSLRRRLLVSASLLLLVFLGLMGVVLNKAFEQSVLSNAEDALRSQVLLLMANMDVDGTEIVVPEALSEPRLTMADGTLYAQIESANAIVWRSPSLLGATLPDLSAGQGQFIFHPKAGWPEPPQIYQLSFAAVWETEAGDVPFTIQVAEHRGAYLQRMRDYQQRLILWLSILGCSLLALLLALLRWGLQPLVRVTRQVNQIEEGQRQRFSEDYPLEVRRLTQNLNQLLNFEEQRIERQKQVLGNLAHSLKTPLAVLHGLNYAERNQPEVKEQLKTMQTIIDYQLQGASAVGRQRFAKPIHVLEPTQKLVSSLQKLHQEKQIKVQLQIDDDVVFYGDQGDWMDLAGNLLENAFKWTASEIIVKARNLPVDGNPESHRLAIEFSVSDDGEGIAPNLQETILQRGIRLDSQSPGHGLGLHIVKGIVEAYAGELQIHDNSHRGTQFVVRLN